MTRFEQDTLNADIKMKEANTNAKKAEEMARHNRAQENLDIWSNILQGAGNLIRPFRINLGKPKTLGGKYHG